MAIVKYVPLVPHMAEAEIINIWMFQKFLLQLQRYLEKEYSNFQLLSKIFFYRYVSLPLVPKVAQI